MSQIYIENGVITTESDFIPSEEQKIIKELETSPYIFDADQVVTNYLMENELSELNLDLDICPNRKGLSNIDIIMSSSNKEIREELSNLINEDFIPEIIANISETRFCTLSIPDMILQYYSNAEDGMFKNKYEDSFKLSIMELIDEFHLMTNITTFRDKLQKILREYRDKNKNIVTDIKECFEKVFEKVKHYQKNLDSLKIYDYEKIGHIPKHLADLLNEIIEQNKFYIDIRSEMSKNKKFEITDNEEKHISLFKKYFNSYFDIIENKDDKLLEDKIEKFKEMFKKFIFFKDQTLNRLFRELSIKNVILLQKSKKTINTYFKEALKYIFQEIIMKENLDKFEIELKNVFSASLLSSKECLRNVFNKYSFKFSPFLNSLINDLEKIKKFFDLPLNDVTVKDYGKKMMEIKSFYKKYSFIYENKKRLIISHKYFLESLKNLKKVFDKYKTIPDTWLSEIEDFIVKKCATSYDFYGMLRGFQVEELSSLYDFTLENDDNVNFEQKEKMNKTFKNIVGLRGDIKNNPKDFIIYYSILIDNVVYINKKNCNKITLNFLKNICKNYSNYLDPYENMYKFDKTMNFTPKLKNNINEYETSRIIKNIRKDIKQKYKRKKIVYEAYLDKKRKYFNIFNKQSIIFRLDKNSFEKAKEDYEKYYNKEEFSWNSSIDFVFNENELELEMKLFEECFFNRDENYMRNNIIMHSIENNDLLLLVSTVEENDVNEMFYITRSIPLSVFFLMVIYHDNHPPNDVNFYYPTIDELKNQFTEVENEIYNEIKEISKIKIEKDLTKEDIFKNDVDNMIQKFKQKRLENKNIKKNIAETVKEIENTPYYGIDVTDHFKSNLQKVYHNPNTTKFIILEEYIKRVTDTTFNHYFRQEFGIETIKHLFYDVFIGDINNYHLYTFLGEKLFYYLDGTVYLTYNDIVFYYSLAINVLTVLGKNALVKTFNIEHFINHLEDNLIELYFLYYILDLRCELAVNNKKLFTDLYIDSVAKETAARGIEDDQYFQIYENTKSHLTDLYQSFCQKNEKYNEFIQMMILLHENSTLYNYLIHLSLKNQNEVNMDMPLVSIYDYLFIDLDKFNNKVVYYRCSAPNYEMVYEFETSHRVEVKEKDTVVVKVHGTTHFFKK